MHLFFWWVAQEARVVMVGGQVNTFAPQYFYSDLAARSHGLLSFSKNTHRANGYLNRRTRKLPLKGLCPRPASLVTQQTCTFQRLLHQVFRGHLMTKPYTVSECSQEHVPPLRFVQF